MVSSERSYHARLSASHDVIYLECIYNFPAQPFATLCVRRSCQTVEAMIGQVACQCSLEEFRKLGRGWCHPGTAHPVSVASLISTSAHCRQCHGHDCIGYTRHCG